MLDVLASHHVDVDREAIIVRDGAGRLTFVKEKIAKSEDLVKDLREALGAYAAPMPIVGGSLALRLRQDTRLRRASLQHNGSEIDFLYADRRIVGADWMLAPQASPNGAKRLVFSSLKGGVGRSTALAILAADLSRKGKRVLAIDLDIEAPGIGFMMLPPGDGDDDLDLRPDFGAIDYLIENGLNGVDDYDLDKFIGVSPFAEGSIDVVPAIGRVTDENPSSMIAKLSRALVEDSTPAGPKGLAQQIREMVDRFSATKDYDVILIDARAGMAEVSAAALLWLGAEILFFGTDQPQTFRGYRYILSHLVETAGFSQNELAEDWREKITFVQSKAPPSAVARSQFRERLYSMCAELIYESETLNADGIVELGAFNPAPDATGPGVPHDAIYVDHHPAYEAFDPLSDRASLDTDVYRGPFGPFLERCRAILDLESDTMTDGE
ncbi:Mrp family chromosome partitioning ATPase [Methylobacterium brachiatum]|uniref:Mrp family chromosome partitioning ATPase n=2 Tax=Methylobacterium brachiatum TaxID=269660 RepID=A0AAJ1TM33_9HYPH|nr:AAA family ATPase [Methylobacterium brachiatum]MCB4802630.1 AAA family ATPase [Methylobacterium brachiatum]MDQ0543256.1 Mrp family chromosome partitioning ATPase [Methylobacterium brachiatum]